jgi:hypothetical protein
MATRAAFVAPPGFGQRQTPGSAKVSPAVFRKLYQAFFLDHFESCDVRSDVQLQTMWPMSRFLLNIEKRSLSWLTLCGVGLASKNAM